MIVKLSEMFGAKDMTEGSPASCLIKFSIPLLIGNLAQQLYSTVDSIVVGHFVGDGALAAVGATGPILNLLLVLFMGISTGATVMASQYFGAKQKDMLSASVGTTITLTLIAGILMTIVGPLLARPFLSLLGTPDEIFEMSATYLIIIMIGILGCAYYNIIAGLLRGLGDSVMPLIFLLVACGLNIVLDVLFVAAFNMGVAGVAWATIISQAISAMLCVRRLLHMHDVMTIDRHSLKLKKELVLKLTGLGLPSGLTQAIFSMAQILVQSLTNSFGTAVIAVSTVVMRVDGFAMMPNFTFGTAMTTYSGQNIGAGNLKRVEEGTKDGMKIGLMVSVVLVAAILIFGESLMRMFTKTEEVVNLSMHMMKILAVGYVAMAVTQILCGVMRGAGDTMTPMWISIITTVLLRVPVAYVLAHFTKSADLPVGSPDSLYISLLMSWVMGGLLSFAFYKRGKWRTKSIVK